MWSLIVISITSFLISCDWRSSLRPSVLVVAVEGLSSELFFCGEADSEFSEGLGVLCEEGVRFTHAFTPSTMSQASLTSLMTGRYPTETGVVQNGMQFLSEKYVTAAEAALDKGYRTSFFSGGAPIWSKSGLDQGFEIFEDNQSILFSKPYREAAQNFNYFLNWYDDQKDGRPFFSVIYLSDLQYPQFITVNDHGQERAMGRDSQLREINESFANFVNKLKQKKIWDNTFIIFTGLNGILSEGRENEIVTTNLHVESTQVLLMIKSARKSRDLGINWAIDANVSLVDVGATLFDLLGLSSYNRSKNETLNVISLLPTLTKPQVNWSRDRLILLESAWPGWRGVGTTRFALRKGNLLYIHDQIPRVYNTLTDRFEAQPLHLDEKTKYAAPMDMQIFFKENGLQSWSGLPMGLIEKIRLYQDISLRQTVHGDTRIGDIKNRLSRLIRQRIWDKQLVGWLAQIALEEKDWALLEELGTEHFYPIWVYVAKRLRGETLVPPQEACWERLFKNNIRANQRHECEDQEFRAFTEMESATDASKKARLLDKFIRLYIYAEIDEQLASLNFQNGLSWDVNVNVPAQPRLSKLALMLPEYKSIRLQVEGQLRTRLDVIKINRAQPKR